MNRIIAIFLCFCAPHICADNARYKTLFEGKKILITGGTGYIGRGLTEAILQYDPSEIIIFSRDEVKHYNVLTQFNDPRLKSVLGDVRDYDSLLYATKGVDIVIHAAALKRLDILEYNIQECINTNILGTVNIARACIENDVETALFVSSDKACLPVNTYGACKFISEKVFTNLGSESSKTRLLAVRYGNVLESTGSVIPLFCEKIKNNEIIPLTDAEMTRFFIAKEQAIQLIFKALYYGQGGEIFVPRIPAFKITDLIAVLQKKFNVDNGIKIIGLRPGEKIHELMINTTEVPRTYKFQDLYIITPTIGNGIKDAAYQTNGERLTTEHFPEYISRDEIMSQDDLMALLTKYDVAH